MSRQGSLAWPVGACQRLLLSSIPPSRRKGEGDAYLSAVADSRSQIPAATGTRTCHPTHDDARPRQRVQSDGSGIRAYLDTWTGTSGRGHVDCRPATTGLLCCTVPMLIDVLPPPRFSSTYYYDQFHHNASNQVLPND